MIPSKHDAISRELKARIFSGELTGALPGVKQLAVDFGVNMITVNKAVKSLEKENLVLRIPRKGTYVRRQKNILVAYHDSSPNFFEVEVYTGVIAAIQKKLTENNCFMIFENLYGKTNQSLENLRNRIDGAIILSGGMTPLASKILSELPVVVIMGRIKKDGSWDHVTYRTGEVPRIAADYLLKKGCRVCAHIGWRQGYLFEERANVFKEQIEKAGAVCRFYESPMNFERKDILLQLEQLKNDPDRPDGVFCSTDSEASAAAMFCYENGIRPERDISIIGCNNDTFLSHFMPGSAPATIDLRRTEIGTAAAEILLSRIDGDRKPRIIQQFTPELIIPNQKERTK